jgi:hypothetical protein
VHPYPWLCVLTVMANSITSLACPMHLVSALRGHTLATETSTFTSGRPLNHDGQGDVECTLGHF